MQSSCTEDQEMQFSCKYAGGVLESKKKSYDEESANEGKELGLEICIFRIPT